MITLHKLNGSPITLNAELIETLEGGGGSETCVALATGNRYLVREPVKVIEELVIEYRKKVHGSGKTVNPIAGFERHNP